MSKIGLKIPESVKNLLKSEKQFKNYRDLLQYQLDQFHQVIMTSLIDNDLMVIY